MAPAAFSSPASPATDAVLAADVTEAATAAPTTGPPRHILLTGATGFLGAFLLRELLDRTDADIWCLVRAENDLHAHRRISDTQRRYLLPDPPPRVVPVAGDLTAPRLGLTPARWAELCATVDAVHHSGAQVGHAAPYTALRAANVAGTVEIIRLAWEHHRKPVEFISTAAVPGGPAGPAALPPSPSSPGAGYVTGKWVAEHLVHQAAARGLPARIHRPGRISGHSATGACQLDDGIWHLVRAVALLGHAPDIDDGPAVSCAPVDYVARAVVHTSRLPPDPATAVRTFPLVNHERLSVRTLVAHAARRYPVTSEPPGDFLRRLWEARHSGDDGLVKASLLLPYYRALLDGTGRPPQADDARTVGELADAGITCPPIGPELLDAYLDFFEAAAFLPPGLPAGTHHIRTILTGN